MIGGSGDALAQSDEALAQSVERHASDRPIYCSRSGVKCDCPRFKVDEDSSDLHPEKLERCQSDPFPRNPHLPFLSNNRGNRKFPRYDFSRRPLPNPSANFIDFQCHHHPGGGTSCRRQHPPRNTIRRSTIFLLLIAVKAMLTCLQVTDTIAQNVDPTPLRRRRPRLKRSPPPSSPAPSASAPSAPAPSAPISKFEVSLEEASEALRESAEALRESSKDQRECLQGLRETAKALRRVNDSVLSMRQIHMQEIQVMRDTLRQTLHLHSSFRTWIEPFRDEVIQSWGKLLEYPSKYLILWLSRWPFRRLSRWPF